MEDIVAIIAVFGLAPLVLFINKWFKYREKLLDVQRAGDPGRIAVLEKEKKLLEGRIENLESIVCSVDFELNQRLNKLAVGLSQQMRALPDVSVPPSPSALGGALSQLPSAMLARKSFSRDAALSATGTFAPPLAVGQVVRGRYRVVRELGRGGMGAVYLAEDATLGEAVALKVISSAMSDDPAAATQRFLREVQAARKVTHENVVRIHDLGEDGPLLFLSMEYVAGETLAARIKREGPLPVADGLDVVGKVALGVGAAHAVGVTHRDLKPHNVLCASGGVVKVIDFGLATASYMGGMTATGMILGTPEYMAPEQLRGAPCDARTDVYALGVLAFQAFAGRTPFAGETPIAVGFAHLSEEAPRLRAVRAEVPETLDAAVARALAKDPAARFASATEFRAALA